MVTKSDIELLREFAADSSEPAFSTLVARHVDMVYSVGLRRLGNHHQAEEVAQAVFIVLAKKARTLRQGTVLSGWLFQTARLTAANYLRTEIRRTRREQEAYMQSNLAEKSAAVWPQIAPLLDDAIADLGEKDRNAIVLRYVKGATYQDVGAALDSSEEAAQVRVSRAVEKLRKIFTKRGIVLSAAVLSGAISANVIQAAPVGLPASIVAAAVKGTALTASTLALVKGTLNFMAWTKIKIAAGVAVAGLVAYQYYQNISQSRQLALAQEQLQTVRQQVDSQRAVMGKLEQENLATVAAKRDAELAGAKLLARQQAGFDAATQAAEAKAAVNVTDTNPPATGIVKMMSDPAMKEYIRDAQLRSIKTRYADLFKQLKLSPEDSEKFTQVFGDYLLKVSEMGSEFSKGNGDRAETMRALAEAKTGFDGQLQSLLGDDGYSQFKSYTREMPARTTVTLLNDQLNGNPLTDDQGARLLQLVKAEPYNLTHGIVGALDSALFGSQEEIDKHFQAVAESNQRILQQASAFLTPQQLEALGAVQAKSLHAQQIQGAALAQKH